jgi:hypothetical protein
MAQPPKINVDIAMVATDGIIDWEEIIGQRKKNEYGRKTHSRSGKNSDQTCTGVKFGLAHR